MQLYLAALQNYQFQVNLTWSRTQYCLTLNAALVSVAAGLIRLDNEAGKVLVGAVFAVGFSASMFSILALDVGRSYYVPVMQRMRILEARLGIQEYGVRTTAEQGGPTRRMNITHSLKVLFFGIAVIDAGGVLYALLAG